MAETSERLLLIRERRFLLGLMLVAGVVALWLVRGFVAWAVLGLLLGYICLPLHRRVMKWVGGRKEVSAMIVLTVAVLAVVVPIGVLIWSVTGDVTRLVGNIQERGLDNFLEGIFVKVMPEGQAHDLAAKAAIGIPDFLLGLLPDVLTAIVDATVGVFILASALLAVLTKGDEIMTWLHRVVPLRRDREEAFFNGFQVALDAVDGVLIQPMMSGTCSITCRQTISSNSLSGKG